MAKGHRLTSCLPILRGQESPPPGRGEQGKQRTRQSFIPAVRYESLDCISSTVVDICWVRKCYGGLFLIQKLLIILVRVRRHQHLEQMTTAARWQEKRHHKGFNCWYISRQHLHANSSSSYLYLLPNLTYETPIAM